MSVVIKGFKIVGALKKALTTNIDQLKAQQEARQRRSVSIREAANILRVRPALVRSWILDLGGMHLDENGKVPIPEARRFISSDWKWLLPSRRLQLFALQTESETQTNE